jgi:hypothetical protein
LLLNNQQGAIADLKQAAESLNPQGSTADYQQVWNIIEKMLPGTVALG